MHDDNISDAAIVSGTEFKALDLDRIFSEVGSGYRAIIKRIMPTWCDGIIDTVELDPDEPISIEWLAQEYGGRKLQIIIHDSNGKYVTARTVKFPHPPRHEGRTMIREPSEGAQPQNQTSSMGEMREIFQLMIASQQSQTEALVNTIAKRLDKIESSESPAAATPPKNALKEGLSALREIENFKDEFGLGGTEPPIPDPEDSPISRAIDKFTDLMIEKEHAKIEQSMRQAPHSPQLQPQSTYTPPSPDGTRQTSQNSSAPPTPAQIQDQIANLADVELAAHVKMRLQNMPPEDRERAIHSFLDELGDLDDDDLDEDFVGEESKDDLNSNVRVLDGGIDDTTQQQAHQDDNENAPA